MMMRGIPKVCGFSKAVFLEPYVTSYQVSSHHATASLPRLPVPKLNDTLQKYLKSARPLLSDEEFQITCNLVKEFAAVGGVGQILQSLLVKRAENHVNWLEEWWLNVAYLEYRNPVVVYSSPGLVFPFQCFKSQDDQLRYAARTLSAAMQYKNLIDSDKIPLEMMGKNPLDMSQYKKIFGTCRVPFEKRDRLSYNDSKHITVIHNDHIFHLDLWGKDGVLLSEEQITQQLRKIIQLSPLPAPNGIGILTSENRDAWAKAYQLLSRDKLNKLSLVDVEKSLVILCLDAAVGLWNCPDKHSRQNVAAMQTIHGGGSNCNSGNRWFDKTIQFIVGADGITGLTYEHSPAEGQPIAVMTDFIMKYLDQDKAPEKPGSSCAVDPVRLDFVVDFEVACMIQEAKRNMDRLVCDLALNCFTFDRYGKNFIKTHKLSPDSYLQMAMQYTFYRVHKTPGAHYESAATRMFVGGRTETIRSCSVESVEFAKTMLDPQSSNKAKIAAMQRAIVAHKEYTVQALLGLGVDRHFLGLKLVAMENGIELPRLYTDLGFVKSAHMRISTSQVACKCDGFMAYAPLVPDGYATCYNPRNNDINFATSAFASNPETNCDTYRCALEQSLQDMHDVLLSNTPSKL